MRRLPPLLYGGLRANAALELAVVKSAKRAHQSQSRWQRELPRLGRALETYAPSDSC